MPSPIDSTCPTSATSASVPKLAICCFRIAEISAARISIESLFQKPIEDDCCASAACLHRRLQPLQFAAQRTVHHARAQFDDHAAEQLRIDAGFDRNPAP